MAGRRWDLPDRTPATLLLLAVLACPLASASAQEVAPAPAVPTDADRVEMTTAGTYLYFRPQAHVRLERPSFVAVFEVEPGVGATLLYPADAWSQQLEPAGGHDVALTGHRARTARRAMARHLAGAFAHRPPVVPRSHLVVVASDRPLRLDGLLSGRILEHDRGRAGVGEVTRALLAHVTRWERPGASWDWAATSYWKFRDPGVLALGAGLPWLGGNLQFFRPFRGHTSLMIPWCLPPWWGSAACPLREREETRLADLPRDLADPASGPRDGEERTDRAAPRLPDGLRALLARLADATTRLDRDERGTLRTLELLGAAAEDRPELDRDLPELGGAHRGSRGPGSGLPVPGLDADRFRGFGGVGLRDRPHRGGTVLPGSGSRSGFDRPGPGPPADLPRGSGGDDAPSAGDQGEGG